MQRWAMQRQFFKDFGAAAERLPRLLGGGLHYRNRDGKPISFEKWTRCMRSEEYRRVNQTTVGHYHVVSTVWLGLSPTPGTLFETMVFAKGSPLDFGMERYADIREAFHGHDRMVAEVRASLQ